MLHTLLLVGLYVSGVFAVVLGAVHFFFPLLWDFTHAIPREGGSPLGALRPMRLGPLRYAVKRSDVYGITWVMNHAASLTILTIGVVDLWAASWLGTPLAPLIAGWIALFWGIRAVSQLYLGRRPGDWAILAGFALLAVWHGIAAVWG